MKKKRFLMIQKKLFPLFGALVFFVCLLMLQTSAFAAGQNIASGSGWVLDSNNCLHITGRVNNPSDDFDESPWINYKESIYSIVAEDGAAVNNGTYLFYRCINTKSADLRKLNTSGMTSMRKMFSHCVSVTNLQLGNMDTSKVTDMMETFYRCDRLQSLDLSSFDTSSAEIMSYMFGYDYNLLSLDLRSFDTSNVFAMDQMFSMCKNLTSVNLSSFDTRNVKHFWRMFEDCESLKTIDLSNFDTRKGLNFNHMFCNCKSLQSINLSNFDASNVTTMYSMFENCESLTSLDLSNFYSTTVKSIGRLVNGCPNLKYLDIRNISSDGFVVCNDVFYNASSLTQVHVNPTILSKIADQLIGVSADWLNLENGISYSTAEDLAAISGTAKLRNMAADIGSITVYNPVVPDDNQVSVEWTSVSRVDHYEVVIARYDPVKRIYVSGRERKRIVGKTSCTFDAAAFSLSDLAGDNSWYIRVYACAKDGLVLASGHSYAFKVHMRFLATPTPDLGPNGKVKWNTVFGATQYVAEIRDENKEQVAMMTVEKSFADFSSYMKENTKYRCYVTAYDAKGRYLASDTGSSEWVTYDSSQFYGIYVAGVPVTEKNRYDVLGDGSVKFLPNGLAYGSELIGETLVLQNLRLTTHRTHVTECGREALISIDRDIHIACLGQNILSLDWRENLDGIHISSNDSVSFYGDSAGCSSLTIRVSNNGGRAINAPGACISIWRDMDMCLFGHYGFYSDYSDSNMGGLELCDDAFVQSFGYRADDDTEGYALYSPELVVNDDATFYAEYEWNQQAVSTWDLIYSYNSPLSIWGARNIPGIVNDNMTYVEDTSGSWEHDYRILRINAGDSRIPAVKLERSVANPDQLVGTVFSPDRADSISLLIAHNTDKVYIWTPGIIRIRYTELSDNNTFTLDVSDMDDCVIRACVEYLSGDYGTSHSEQIYVE